MFSYEILEKECYYIVQLEEGAELTLVQVKVITDNCLFIIQYNETADMRWVKKTDAIYDIVECLSDEAAQQWLAVYNSEDASYYEGDEE